MNREEILKKAQNDNGGRDEADLQAQKQGAWIAYIVGIIGIIAVDVVNAVVLGTIYHGANMVICLMAFVAFIIKYRQLKKKHELFVSVFYGALTLLFFVFWLLQLLHIW